MIHRRGSYAHPSIAEGLTATVDQVAADAATAALQSSSLASADIGIGSASATTDHYASGAPSSDLSIDHIVRRSSAPYAEANTHLQRLNGRMDDAGDGTAGRSQLQAAAALSGDSSTSTSTFPPGSIHPYVQDFTGDVPTDASAIVEADLGPSGTTPGFAAYSIPGEGMLRGGSDVVEGTDAVAAMQEAYTGASPPAGDTADSDADAAGRAVQHDAGRMPTPGQQWQELRRQMSTRVGPEAGGGGHAIGSSSATGARDAGGGNDAGDEHQRRVREQIRQYQDANSGGILSGIDQVCEHEHAEQPKALSGGDARIHDLEAQAVAASESIASIIAGIDMTQHMDLDGDAGGGGAQSAETTSAVGTASGASVGGDASDSNSEYAVDAAGPEPAKEIVWARVTDFERSSEFESGSDGVNAAAAAGTGVDSSRTETSLRIHEGEAQQWDERLHPDLDLELEHGGCSAPWGDEVQQRQRRPVDVRLAPAALKSEAELERASSVSHVAHHGVEPGLVFRSFTTPASGGARGTMAGQQRHPTAEVTSREGAASHSNSPAPQAGQHHQQHQQQVRPFSNLASDHDGFKMEGWTTTSQPTPAVPAWVLATSPSEMLMRQTVVSRPLLLLRTVAQEEEHEEDEDGEDVEPFPEPGRPIPRDDRPGRPGRHPDPDTEPVPYPTRRPDPSEGIPREERHPDMPIFRPEEDMFPEGQRRGEHPEAAELR